MVIEGLVWDSGTWDDYLWGPVVTLTGNCYLIKEQTKELSGGDTYMFKDIWQDIYSDITTEWRYGL